ncbi:transporter substrate-binding domain-containing protein [Ornithinibacillus sp. L9]|uniref:Transporter substrate-binding domain-containing protein n=1 Tax=Ornithinibacillus caprae TaxID=2678566 RepID=A0A6N8FEX4_9BACI|nr:amino acid ABC transporter substrate-binding protein [Ornithinibacillus caprae]MUK87741.1 transporter substrate-binding domain-containing protein [Ornithinibacillus caprae]
MKKFMWVVFIAFMVIFSGCGTDTEDEPTDNGGQAGRDADGPANSYEEIMERGVLTVGTEGTYPPFTFHNEQDELTGYDVEVIREVADRMGLEVEFQETQWDAMFAGLNSERFDLIANQVGIREDRLENYDFSIPYTISSPVIVVPEDNTDINSFEDLEGKQSAQSLTSNYGDIAEEYGAELVSVEGLAQAIELIRQGRVEVTVNDRLAVLDFMQAQPEAGMKIAARTESSSENAFAFRKGNEELVEAVNKQLEAMKEDGTLAEISEKWFGEDVSQ